jgi:hypothetical protein
MIPAPFVIVFHISKGLLPNRMGSFVNERACGSDDTPSLPWQMAQAFK